MLLKYFYDRALAQASYMVGCAETGEALVVDPARDIRPYLEAARQEGLRINHVTETHIHADFVSGSRELASVTGAHLYLSDMGGKDWKYGFDAVPVHDGDSWMVGNICIEAIHTPGHTPEHLVLQVTDTAGADAPIGLFTGDFLFVGDVGRPDLLEEAAGVANTSEPGARQQFANVQRFKTMVDYLQVWPGHGAGSACGKALGAIPSTTLGYEKLFNPAFQLDDESAFVRWLLSDQPEVPRYFARMKRVNRAGPPLLHDLPAPRKLDHAALDEVLRAGLLVIDTRSPNDFARSHVAGTLSIPASSGSFATYAGWFVDYDRPTYLIAEQSDIESAVHKLRAIGVDDTPGHFSPEVIAGNTQPLPRMTPQELSDHILQDSVVVVDVRAATEHHSQRIPGVRHIHFGQLREHLEELPTDVPIVLHCATGIRSHIAASFLQQQGLYNVSNLKGGLEAWVQAGFSVEEGL
jgi:hydroxyacylglutathione hydrolase